MNADNLVGEVLGERYEILDKIGTGGMATVYKAKDTLLNRNVAIKILRDSLEDEKGIVTNFVREAQSSASLSHSNIVSVYDVGETDGLSYMVMELVDGITLKQYIKQNGMLPWQEACGYAIQIGQGINEAHAQSVIHCDIKPQNIMMTEDKILKVTDFGIAKAVSSGTTVVGGTALGSVHYISPEQARGGFTDARSDIYSMGIVLYEMLAGKVPFDGDNAVGIAMKHLEEEPVDVKCINLDIPSDLDYIVMKAIKKEQAQRYQTVQDMLNDLHAVLASEPLPSRIDEEPPEEPEEIREAEDELFDDEIKTVAEELEDNQRRVRTNRREIDAKRAKAQKEANRNAVLLAIATIAVIVLLGVAAYSIVNNFMLRTAMPDLTNMTVDEARQLTHQHNLVIADEDIEYSISDTVGDGRIISHEPEKGVSVEKNTRVKIIVSLGSRGGNIPVPDLINKTRNEALELIGQAGLKFTIIEENSNTVPAGNVIRQTPVAGTKLFADDYVTIFISKGISTATAAPAGMTTVPYILNVDIDVARNMLSDAGLSLAGISVANSYAPYGTIISQSVASGANVPRGSSVSVTISGGTEQSQNEAVAESQANNEYTESNNNSYSETHSGGGHSGSATFYVAIPEGPSDESVDVQVYVNGVFANEFTSAKGVGTVPVDVSGSGDVNVTVYVDGVEQSETFSF